MKLTTDDLTTILAAALPYVEEAGEGPSNKETTHAAKLAKEMRTAIERTDGWLTTFGELPIRAKFSLPRTVVPIYQKVSTDEALVLERHRQHPKVPENGILTPAHNMEVANLSAAPLHLQWMHGLIDKKSAMLQLARSFPGMRGFWDHETARFDPDALEREAGKLSSGEVAVVRFLLNVWNPGIEWKAGKFCLADVANIDPADRAALAAWIAHPWWP